mgnify:FL=1
MTYLEALSVEVPELVEVLDRCTQHCSRKPNGIYRKVGRENDLLVIDEEYLQSKYAVFHGVYVAKLLV